MDAENNGRIDQIPLRELSISRSLRRDLQKAGARTLAEAFALDNRAIFANLSVQSDRELEGYQRTFKKDPERLRRELLQPKTEQIARGFFHSLWKNAIDFIHAMIYNVGVLSRLQTTRLLKIYMTYKNRPK